MSNHHFLYVRTGVATKDQVMEVFTKAVQGTAFIINLVYSRSKSDPDGPEKPHGYGYVWIENIEIANQICGLNPDGSERYEITEGVSGKVRIALPPLISIPPYQYNDEQYSYVKGRYTIGDAPRDGYVSVAFADLSPLESTKVRDTVYSHGIPSWLTVDMIRTAFSRYAADTTTVYERKINGEMVNVTYPIVNIVNIHDRQTVFINFDSRTDDARYALLMMKKATFMIDGTNRVVIFDHPTKRRN